MLLPVKFSFSRISYPYLVQTLAPFLSGGIVIGGLAVTHSSVAAFFTSLGLGNYSTAGIFVFAAYISGFVVDGVSSGLLSMLAFLTHRLLDKTSPQLWEEVSWRKAARKFVGSDLAPEKLGAPIHEISKDLIDETKEIKDPQKRIAAMIVLANEKADRFCQEDLEWFEWFLILRRYFPTVPQADTFTQVSVLFTSTLHSIGWAGIVVLAFASDGHWLLWVFSVLSILVGGLGLFAHVWNFTSEGFDKLGHGLTADIIRELKKGGA